MASSGPGVLGAKEWLRSMKAVPPLRPACVNLEFRGMGAPETIDAHEYPVHRMYVRGYTAVSIMEERLFGR